MIVKNKGFSTTHLSQFDLLGYKETAFTKAFAFLLSKEPEALFIFLRSLGITVKKTPNNINNIEIIIEKAYQKHGRTDVEIKLDNTFHIIIEAKIGNNTIQKQHSQYCEIFSHGCKNNIMCFISTERDTNLQIDGNITFISISWYDIIELYENHNSDILKDFSNYLIKNFKMRNQKEILIQDLGDKIEVSRYLDCNIYRRDVTNGTPLYFAPYFTKNSNQQEGVVYISKILGVITTSAADISNFNDNLSSFSEGDNILIEKWNKGVNLGESNPIKYTYYFLSDPIKLAKPLLKDGGKQKGRGKNWIAAKIPKNRCITFEILLSKLQEP